MTEIDKEKLAQVIDKCMEASEKLDRVEVVVKGIRSEIDEISTTLFFHYKKEDD